jgi:hypothetical protein
MTAVTAPARLARREAVLWQLARLEIRRYLRHPLYLLGVALLLLSVAGMVASSGSDQSPLSAPIAPAFLMGVFGVVVAAQLAASGRRLGRGAGAVPLPERTRSLALAVAFVVPVLTAAAWLATFLVIYHVNPPADGVWWFGPLSSGHVLSMLVGTTVVSAFGGPALGMLVARWVRWRPAPLVAAVLLVVAGMLTQSSDTFPRTVGLLMPWTQWSAGVTDGRAVYYGGSPQWWLLYALALCVLAVVAAMYRDPDADRPRYRVAAAVVVLVAVVSVSLAATTGVDHTRYLPVTTASGS